MKPIFTKGQLITWKEDRGFGFIKANHGGKDVFLHISALPEDSRAPKVGDTILYQRVTTPKGKVRAAKASISGIKPKSPTPKSPTPQSPTPKSPTPKRHKPKRHKPKKNGSILKTIAGLVSLSVVALSMMQRTPSRSPDPITAVTQPDCTIKGNVSINTGKKLYHLPGMKNYDDTVISPEYGEKWFCTETDAIKNGWTKAPN